MALVFGAMLDTSMLTICLLLRVVMVTLSLLNTVPLAWMLRRESVWFSPCDVPARGL